MAERNLIAVELDDSFGPRRRPDRPNIWVEATELKPEARLEQLMAGSEPRLSSASVVGLRTDLTAAFGPAKTRVHAKKQVAKLSARLRRRGFTVNGQTTVWTVYSIELRDPAGALHPGRRWVYVGSTSKDPVERVRQHLDGVRNAKGPLFSKVAYRYGMPPSGAPKTHGIYFSKEAGVRAEREVALRLKAEGFCLESDGLTREERRCRALTAN